MQVKGAYDLIVIGDQLSGLFLAAGAAQSGMRVLVLEESSVAPVAYEAPSGRLLGDFLAEPLIGLDLDSPIDSFLRSLGLYQDPDDLFPYHEPPLQLVGKGLRLDFPYEAKALNEALEREYGADPAKLAGLQRLLGGAVLEKGSFAQAVAAAGLPVEFEELGWQQTALYGAMASTHVTYPAYKEVFAMAAKGVRYPLGGRAALRERLQARITVYGGNIKRATHVDEIVFEKGRLAGVLLSSYEGFVRSPRVVGAMGARTFFHLVPEEFRPAALKSAVQRIHPRFWRLSFTVLIPEGSVPEGMGTHVALQGAGEDPFLQLQLFPKEAYGGVPAGHRALVVRMLVPFEPNTLGEKAVARHLKRAIRRLGDLFPFLNERPFQLAPDPEKLGTDPAYVRYFRYKDLDHIPPSYLAYEAALDEGLDQSRYLDWSRYGLNGLALCSRDIYPLFGGTGEILAAMELLSIYTKKGRGDK